ncbi:MAG: hypothetical protein ACXWNG_02005 [Candidatus Limnocylindrales bacterium]
MSKRHQSNRRRSYGRRQHELHERSERRWEPDEPQRPAEELPQVDLFQRVGAVLSGPRLAFGGD